MSALDLEQLAMDTNPEGACRRPTPEDWAKMKNYIHEIYIKNNRSRKVLMQMMKRKGFDATPKMYTDQFKRWGAEFNKNQNSDGTRLVFSSDTPRTRPRRRVDQVVPRAHFPHLRPRLSMDTQLSDGYTRYRAFLNSTKVYVYGLFDSFNLSANMFDVIVPVGTTDYSSVWQQIGAEIFGFITLLESNKTDEAWITYNIVGERLKSIVGVENDYGMIIKLWPICTRLLNAAVIYRDDSILFRLLHFLRRLVIQRYNKGGRDHPIPKLLTCLCQIPIGEFSKAIQMGYLKTIHCLENRLSFDNPLVQSTWSNYMNKCDRQALPVDVLTSRYSTVLQAARQSFTPTGTRTIEILHDYIYTAYYNAEDYQLTWNLAWETVRLAGSPELMREHPIWCKAMQSYALAVKLMYMISRDMGPRNLAVTELELAIKRLEGGDRECGTRAHMLKGILNRSERIAD
ncbi:unnamed protein product [Fusarium graminearum]|nr:unnamed protein product [Fusarium graminearum]VTO91810.1 unnamed protein product [Fusarium graminearum]